MKNAELLFSIHFVISFCYSLALVFKARCYDASSSVRSIHVRDINAALGNVVPIHAGCEWVSVICKATTKETKR